ncbi:hypothetical protein EUGRSUZ_I00617 [Eucalyptus grandis]|uniref:Uncharacterized protein n=2 Tax=Eucalyptus grandis TaxID=71139 RepID=A0ACC3JDI0_EUCGR|nr:hypothetical protein EUGRSUZ_I00617 [Eucalyptus grandis]
MRRNAIKQVFKLQYSPHRMQPTQVFKLQSYGLSTDENLPQMEPGIPPFPVCAFVLVCCFLHVKPSVGAKLSMGLLMQPAHCLPPAKTGDINKPRALYITIFAASPEEVHLITTCWPYPNSI